MSQRGRFTIAQLVYSLPNFFDMWIDELTPLFAKKLGQLDQEKLEPFQKRNSVRLCALVTVVCLVSGEYNIWTCLLLEPVKINSRRANVRGQFIFVFCLKLQHVRFDLLLHADNVWLGVLLVQGYDVLVPLRHYAFVPLRYYTLIPLLLSTQCNWLGNGNSANNVWLDALDIGRYRRVCESLL